MNMQDMVNEFQEERGFQRLFSLFYEKYRIYERLENNISVTIEQPNQYEKDALGGIMGMDYSKRKTIRISISQFEKAIKKTKYAPLVQEQFVEQLVTCYYGKPLRTKKEDQELFETRKNAFFQRFKTEQRPPLLKRIIEWAEKEENRNNRFFLHYKQDKKSLERALEIMSKLLDMFPLESPVYLPIFSSMVTKNPHALDMDTYEGKFLIYTLQIVKELETGEPIKQKINAEEVTELLFNYQIMRDDLMNYVTVFNIEGINKDGEKNMLLDATSSYHMSVNLPLKEVMKLSHVQAKNNKIFMLENSSVASFMMNETSKQEKDVSIICGNGMLKVATLKLLDLFVENGGIIYYAGDFDPEGLGIAERLLQRYGDQVQLWKYKKEDYIKSLSDEKIEPYRLNQLNNAINHHELEEIKTQMKTIKKAGYQENILHELLDSVL